MTGYWYAFSRWQGGRWNAREMGKCQAVTNEWRQVQQEAIKMLLYNYVSAENKGTDKRNKAGEIPGCE